MKKLQIIAGMLGSCDIRRFFRDLWECSHRLKDAVLENKDFESIITARNDPQTVVYCDPPYGPLLPCTYGLCGHQGVFQQSEAGRYFADPDRRGEPLYVLCA